MIIAPLCTSWTLLGKPYGIGEGVWSNYILCTCILKFCFSDSYSVISLFYYPTFLSIPFNKQVLVLTLANSTLKSPQTSSKQTNFPLTLAWYDKIQSTHLEKMHESSGPNSALHTASTAPWPTPESLLQNISTVAVSGGSPPVAAAVCIFTTIAPVKMVQVREGYSAFCTACRRWNEAIVYFNSYKLKKE